MMNKRIRNMIDEIFAELKMTQENLALRDELMANAQARYEDGLAQGKTEEEAFAEVAASLGDVQSLLHEMNAQPEEAAETADAAAQMGDTAQAEDAAQTEETTKQAEDAKDDGARAETDLGEALNRAFSALGDISQQIVRQVDSATGGMIGEIGKAVGRGMRDAQRAAGAALDRMSAECNKARAPQTPETMREQARALREQAEQKQAADDQEGARALRAKAYALETQAEAMEQAQAMEAARRDAARQAEQDAAEAQDGAQTADYTAPDGTLDQDAFASAVDDMAREAEEAARTSSFTIDWQVPLHIERRFPAAGLRTLDIVLDADDVTVEPADGTEVLLIWEAEDAQAVEPVANSDGHTLSVRRRNPDVFKTFFSVFQKNGGQVTLRVPRGYAADYHITTTSGDIRLRGIDVDDVTISTTSGNVRLEPDAGIRAKDVQVKTVSGDATVSVCAGDVAVTTVSGALFVSCDANMADVNTVSGALHAEGACQTWDLSTVSGDAELLCTVVPTSKIQINTISGTARVALPTDVRGFVAELSGLSGGIVNEFGPNRYGTCALPIHMDTMSGKLVLTRL